MARAFEYDELVTLCKSGWNPIHCCFQEKGLRTHPIWPLFDFFSLIDFLYITMTDHTPIIVGLAGGIGSGKSTIARCFNQLGIQSVDADDVARLVVEPNSYCLSEIQHHFGDEILLEDGALNRRALRDIIFNDPAERRWLEALTHPAIRSEILTQLKSTTSEYALLVHPLLFETKQDMLCNWVIAIDVPLEIQRQRVMSRDKVNQESAEKIIATQLSNKERLEKANFILENAGNLDEMNAKVFKLHQKILESLPC